MSAVCLGLIAPSALAAIPSDFVGTQSWEEPTTTQLDRLGNAKVRTFRKQLAWAAVESNKPTNCTATACKTHQYYWDRYDQLFDQAAKERVRIMPVLLGSPEWATPDQRWAPVRGRGGSAYDNVWQRQAFYDFAKEAAKRYGPRGTFWEGKAYAMPATNWQIWNEPNLPNYWWNERDGRRMADEYAQLLRSTSAAVKAGNPSASIVSAGLPWSGIARLQPPDFLRRLFRYSSTAAATNHVAVHPYARTPDLVRDGVRQTRGALNTTPAKYRQIWVTEFGWATGGPTSSFRVDRTTQARYLRETYRKLLGVSSSYGVRGAIWFNLIDVRPPEGKGDAWYFHTGLFNRYDGAKVSWKAMKCVTGTGTCSY